MIIRFLCWVKIYPLSLKARVYFEEEKKRKMTVLEHLIQNWASGMGQGDFFLRAIGDHRRKPKATIEKSSDFNAGAITNEIEFARKKNNGTCAGAKHGIAYY